jgi:CRP/FNR family transcriptional regulator/CRP/FNR family cyclic AMP-dependent transcriptional regulator
VELVSRMLDGSIPWDLGRVLRQPPAADPRVGPDERVRHLQKVPVLQGCTRHQLRAVAGISRVVEVPTGALLTRKGQPGDAFFLILDGSAWVVVSRRERERLGPGDFFGEMALVDGEPRSATVVAETDLRLLVIRREHFWKLLDTVPDLTRRILMTLSRRVRRVERALNH